MAQVVHKVWMFVFACALLSGCATQKPPSYTPQDGVKSQPWRMAWPNGDIEISGTLLSPKEFDKLLILIPNNSPNFEFTQQRLIDSLLESEIAVFTYSDRGIGASTGVYDNSTLAEQAADLTLIARTLRRALGPRTNIGVIGIGIDGWKALMASHYDKRIEYLVLVDMPVEKGATHLELLVSANPDAWRLKREKPNQTIEHYKKIHQILLDEKNPSVQLADLDAYLEGVKIKKKVREKLRSNYYRSIVTTDIANFTGTSTPPAICISSDEKELERISAYMHGKTESESDTNRVQLVHLDQIYENEAKQSLSERATGVIIHEINEILLRTY